VTLALFQRHVWDSNGALHNILNSVQVYILQELICSALEV